jgi:hypothetical protein
MRLLRHAQTVFWVAMCLMALVGLYGNVRTEMERQQPACDQRAR